jgi:murein L,D-transpeptidase YcbB/YkuD
MKKLFHILTGLLLALSLVEASVDDYQQIYEESNHEFLQQMSKEIKKKVVNAPSKVQEAYKAIDYQPIWVDKDYLSPYAEILIAELKEDFAKGLHKELVAEYKKLMPNEDAIFTSDSMDQKVKVELGIMRLYLDSIHNILKDKKSKHTAISLLQKAMQEKSLLHALNEISAERISASTPQLDVNLTAAQKAKLQENRRLAEQLLGSDKKARMKAVYELIGYQPIWLNDSGELTAFSNVLFKQIETDITLEHNGTIYREYKALESAAKPSNKEETLHREFAISKLYQDYMGHVLYGDINWKKFRTDCTKTTSTVYGWYIMYWDLPNHSLSKRSTTTL